MSKILGVIHREPEFEIDDGTIPTIKKVSHEYTNEVLVDHIRAFVAIAGNIANLKPGRVKIISEFYRSGNLPQPEHPLIGLLKLFST